MFLFFAVSAPFQVSSPCRRVQRLTPHIPTTPAHPTPTVVDGGTGALAMDTKRSVSTSHRIMSNCLNLDFSPMNVIAV